MERGSAVRGSAQHHGVAFFPEEARRKSELKNPHAEPLGALEAAGEFRDES